LRVIRSVCLLSALYASAGFAPSSVAQFISPEVHEDGRVTFRLMAPGAQRVAVKGERGGAGISSVEMTKNSEGVWVATIGPLKPDIYEYTFSVDGTEQLDRLNRSIKKHFFSSSLVEVPGDPPLLHEDWDVPHGTLHRHRYPSSVTGGELAAIVYTPPGYDEHRADGYPVIVLMHGMGDDETAWIDVGRANFIADNLLKQGAMEDMLIVMPYGHVIPVGPDLFSSNYWQRNIDGMQANVLENLLPLVSERYNVAADAEHRAIAGLSMGGGQSLSIGLRNLDHFAWVGAFSSAVPEGDLNAVFADLVDDLRPTDDRLRLLWIACGKEDFLLSRNDVFDAWLTDRGIEHAYVLSNGGHVWRLWRQYLGELLPLLFRPASAASG